MRHISLSKCYSHSSHATLWNKKWYKTRADKVEMALKSGPVLSLKKMFKLLYPLKLSLAQEDQSLLNEVYIAFKSNNIHSKTMIDKITYLMNLAKCV